MQDSAEGLQKPPVVPCAYFNTSHTSLCARLYSKFVLRGFGFRSSVGEFAGASILYCQHYCLWHSFVSRKTGNRDGCHVLLFQWLQWKWPRMCIDVHAYMYVTNLCITLWVTLQARALGVTNSCVGLIRRVHPLCSPTVFICLRSGVVNQRVHSLLAKKWKCVILNHSRSAQTGHMWHSVALGVRPHFAYCFYPQRFSHSTPPHQLPSSTFLPLPSPLFPSSVCFCSLNSLLVPMSAPSHPLSPRFFFFVKLHSFALFILSGWLQKRGYMEQLKQGSGKNGQGIRLTGN